MGLSPMYLAVVLLATMLASLAAAQTQDKAEGVGTPAATSQSQQYTVPPNGPCETLRGDGCNPRRNSIQQLIDSCLAHPAAQSRGAGCVTYGYDKIIKAPGFNYTAKLGLQKLQPGCELKDVQILKQYTFGTCPGTRANNYAVKSLGITNTCTDPIKIANTTTCSNVFSNPPSEAFAPSSIGAGSLVDTGNVCWQPPQVFYFVRNLCKTNIVATIKVTTDVYKGDCTDGADSDDGGDDAGGSVSSSAESSSSGSNKSSSSDGLSSGAKAGIAIGVIVGVAIIIALAWFFCCQLRKG